MPKAEVETEVIFTITAHFDCPHCEQHVVQKVAATELRAFSCKACGSIIWVKGAK